jgi:hypothetical protein
MRLIPSCDDLARSVSNGTFDEGPLWDRLRLRLHWLACYFCRRYTAQIRWIDRTAKALWGPADPADGDFKRRLIGRLKN